MDEKYVYVTRDDCKRDPCQWPKAHRHWEFDRKPSGWVKRAEANALAPKELAR